MRIGMRKIKRSTRGAAMLIALFVFFLAALSGTVVLTMAASNAGRYTHEKEDQQAYLSVVSAADLILDRLKGLSITYEGKVEGQAPREENEINIKVEGTGEPDLFLADERFTTNLRKFSINQAWDPMDFSLEAGSGMGKVVVNVDTAGTILQFRLFHVSGSARNYQMTLQVGTTYTEGEYTQDGTDKFFRRHMTFETTSAKFTVEKNVSSGGTGE